jgi:hypothetical protein
MIRSSATPERRVAVVGGRGEAPQLKRLGDTVVLYGSAGDAGEGEARRLESAIRSGSFSHVFVLARWGAHSVTARLRRVCRQTGTHMVVWPSGLSSLAAALSP